MGMRRRAREAALQILYSAEFHEGAVPVAEERFWNTLATHSAPVRGDDDESDAAEGEVSGELRAFASRLARGVAANKDALDDAIRSAATNWRIERMAIVDRNILRQAVFELLHMEEIPTRATLNEAIEIGKRYGTEDSGGFINGVLDRICTVTGQS